MVRYISKFLLLLALMCNALPLNAAAVAPKKGKKDASQKQAAKPQNAKPKKARPVLSDAEKEALKLEGMRKRLAAAEAKLAAAKPKTTTEAEENSDDKRCGCSLSGSITCTVKCVFQLAWGVIKSPYTIYRYFNKPNNQELEALMKETNKEASNTDLGEVCDKYCPGERCQILHRGLIQAREKVKKCPECDSILFGSMEEYRNYCIDANQKKAREYIETQCNKCVECNHTINKYSGDDICVLNAHKENAIRGDKWSHYWLPHGQHCKCVTFKVYHKTCFDKAYEQNGCVTCKECRHDFRTLNSAYIVTQLRHITFREDCIELDETHCTPGQFPTMYETSLRRETEARATYLKHVAPRTAQLALAMAARQRAEAAAASYQPEIHFGVPLAAPHHQTTAYEEKWAERDRERNREEVARREREDAERRRREDAEIRAKAQADAQTTALRSEVAGLKDMLKEVLKAQMLAAAAAQAAAEKIAKPAPKAVSAYDRTESHVSHTSKGQTSTSSFINEWGQTVIYAGPAGPASTTPRTGPTAPPQTPRTGSATPLAKPLPRHPTAARMDIDTHN